MVCPSVTPLSVSGDQPGPGPHRHRLRCSAPTGSHRSVCRGCCAAPPDKQAPRAGAKEQSPQPTAPPPLVPSNLLPVFRSQGAFQLSPEITNFILSAPHQNKHPLCHSNLPSSLHTPFTLHTEPLNDPARVHFHSRITSRYLFLPFLFSLPVSVFGAFPWTITCPYHSAARGVSFTSLVICKATFKTQISWLCPLPLSPAR